MQLFTRCKSRKRKIYHVKRWGNNTLGSIGAHFLSRTSQVVSAAQAQLGSESMAAFDASILDHLWLFGWLAGVQAA